MKELNSCEIKLPNITDIHMKHIHISYHNYAIITKQFKKLCIKQIYIIYSHE